MQEKYFFARKIIFLQEKQSLALKCLKTTLNLFIRDMM
jgi:hypothetical protein